MKRIDFTDPIWINEFVKDVGRLPTTYDIFILMEAEASIAIENGEEEW